ncbi:MAG: ribbon-helix-helix domain-containing protein [Candidatus Nanopelagicales bacterium]
MKVSVSLPDEDVEFLDTYAATSRMTSRSAVLHKAVRLLKAQELSNDYESAWDEWSESDDEQRWDNALADGLDP